MVRYYIDVSFTDIIYSIYEVILWNKAYKGVLICESELIPSLTLSNKR
jgi:hypothetical protein